MPASVVQVSSDQGAQAVQKDRFFSDYRNIILMVQGTVSSVSWQNNDLIVELGTTDRKLEGKGAWISISSSP